mgnify:CR=1 FL=1
MIRVVQCDGYRSITQRLSVFRSGKNDILHGTASKLLCSLLSQHPADCICHIALSTSVWAHDSRNSIVNSNLIRLAKDLNPCTSMHFKYIKHPL